MSTVILDPRYQRISRQRLLVIGKEWERYASYPIVTSYLPNGKREGAEDMCHEETGNLVYKSHYKNGERDGVYERWGDDGILWYRQLWRGDQLIIEQEWSEEGIPLSDTIDNTTEQLG